MQLDGVVDKKNISTSNYAKLDIVNKQSFFNLASTCKEVCDVAKRSTTQRPVSAQQSSSNLTFVFVVEKPSRD